MPLVIFGGSTLLVGFLVLLLRETESDLQETANDAKNQKTEKPEDHKLLDNVEWKSFVNKIHVIFDFLPFY